MEGRLLRSGIIGLLSLLVASFGLSGQGSVLADSTVIGPASSAYVVHGTWEDSRVDLAASVPPSFAFVNIPITDQTYLKPGWDVKVGLEQMHIQSLTEGGYGNPDIMTVVRGVNGTLSDQHASGTAVEAHAVTVDVLAQNVSDPNGLGAFQIILTFPPETQFVRAVYNTAWISSTGRIAWCDGPTFDGTSYRLGCATSSPNPDNPYLHGPTGTGSIATVTVLPPQSLGITTVSLAGSKLASVICEGGPGGECQEIPANISDLKVNTIACPDVNADGRLTVGDQLQVAKNLNAKGVSTTVTLVNAMDQTQTQAEISDQSLLQVADIVSIDNEMMTVQTLTEGSPDTMTIQRAIEPMGPAKPHAAVALLYRSTANSQVTQRPGYTRPRDVTPNGWITSGDQLVLAKAIAALLPAGGWCPAP